MLKRINTGVILSEEEFTEFKKLAEVAQLEFPADVDKGPIAYPNGPWVDLARLVHQVALEKGLPDVPGYYGLDVEGQFVTYSDVPDFKQEVADGE